MPKFITPEIKQLFAQTMADLRSDIGRDIELILDPSTIDCPNCGYDAIAKRSNNKYELTTPYPLAALVNAGVHTTGPVDFNALGMRTCPVCGGSHKISLPGNRVKVLCLINQLTPEDAERTELGKRFRVNYELQTSVEHLTHFKTAKRVIVDGTVCEVVGATPQGIGDLSQVSVYAGAV